MTPHAAAGGTKQTFCYPAFLRRAGAAAVGLSAAAKGTTNRVTNAAENVLAQDTGVHRSGD